MVTSHRFTTGIMTLAFVLGAMSSAVGASPALDQGAGWECMPSAAATSAGGASPVAAAGAVEFPEAGGELTVFAAASLTDAFEQIKTDLEAAQPDLAITYNFAGSQALVTQLTEGAAADAFASANAAQMTAAEEAGVVAEEPVNFVRNQLVIVVLADNPAAIDAAADLGQEGPRLVVAQPEVPVGNYGRQSICLMAEDAATYGDDFVARVAANVVSAEEDVRDVLAKVQLGEGDADLAAAFIAYVLSEDGQATLEVFGFDPVR